MGLEVSAEKTLLSNTQIDEVQAEVKPSNFFINPIQRGQKPKIPVVFVDDSDQVDASLHLYKYINEEAIVRMIKANPKIIKMLNEAQIPLRINMDILNELKKEHLQETKKVVMGIVKALPKSFKSAVNLKTLKTAAILHDFGKVLIPTSILKKEGRLDEKEFFIMQKHADLGYELLKSTDLSEEVLELIRNHHQNGQKTGYPCVEENFVSDINGQILATADMYTALREKRSYKEELGKNKALSIIHQQMKQGKIHPFVFKALVDYANSEEYLAAIKDNFKQNKGKMHPYVFKTVVDNQSVEKPIEDEPLDPINDHGQFSEFQFVNGLCA